VREAKCVRLWFKVEHRLPHGPRPLLTARPVRKLDEVKFLLSHAPRDTPVERPLPVVCSRWPIARLVEDSKTALGLDHFEVP
jgi:SRSO17 transposase